MASNQLQVIFYMLVEIIVLSDEIVKRLYHLGGSARFEPNF